MKNSILFVSLITISILSNAQSTGWETGVSLSVGASDYVITNVDAGQEDDADDVRSIVRPKVYYSMGVYGRKFFMDSYGVQVGINYTSLGAGPKKGIITDFMGNKVGTLRSTSRHNYLEIPVHFIYKKDIGNFGVGGFAGVAPAFLVSSYNRTVLRVGDDKDVDKDSYQNQSRVVNVFADFGVFFRYNITEQLAVDARPFFRIGAVPIYDNNFSPDFDALFIAGGLNVNTVWRF